MIFDISNNFKTALLTPTPPIHVHGFGAFKIAVLEAYNHHRCQEKKSNLYTYVAVHFPIPDLLYLRLYLLYASQSLLFCVFPDPPGLSS